MKTLITVLFFLTLICGITTAQVPQVLSHQGFLANGAGQPVDDTVPMTVRLYADSLGGAAIFTQNFPSVVVANGIYTLSINVSTVPFGNYANGPNPYWLEMEVESITLSPRIRLASVPYALYAATADTARELSNPAHNVLVFAGSGLDPNAIDFILPGGSWMMKGARFQPILTGNNLFIGFDAGKWHTLTFNANTFIGNEAGASSTEGIENTFVGYRAGYGNTIGIDNSFFGKSAGELNTNGAANCFFGAYSGNINTSGNGNSFFGYNAGRNNISNFNTFIGEETGLFNSSGFNNTFVGTQAGQWNTSGYYNTFLGQSAGPTDSSIQYSNSTAVGFDAVTTASDQVRIGSSLVTSIGGYASWTNLSDGRFKTNMAEDVKGLDFILKLRPVTYNLDMIGLEKALHRDQYPPPIKKRSESAQVMAEQQSAMEAKSKIRQSGFVAQEVEQAAKVLGYDFSGIDVPKNGNDFYGLRYAEFVVPLVKAVQELNTLNESLQSKVLALEEENSLLKSQYSNLSGDMKQEIDNLKAMITMSVKNNKDISANLKVNSGK